MRKQPSLIKIIIIDYITFLACLFPMIVWGFFLILIFIQKIKLTEIFYPSIAAVITIAAMGIMAWRIQKINSIFEDGIEVEAIIHDISFFRDRGNIVAIYTYQGQKFISKNTVQKTKSTQMLEIGEQVVVMVNRNNPKNAFIRDLYL